MSFLTYLENMLLFFDYQLKNYNKQGNMIGVGKAKNTRHELYPLICALKSIFNAQNAICNYFLLYYLRVPYS